MFFFVKYPFFKWKIKLLDFFSEGSLFNSVIKLTFGAFVSNMISTIICHDQSSVFQNCSFVFQSGLTFLMFSLIFQGYMISSFELYMLCILLRVSRFAHFHSWHPWLCFFVKSLVINTVETKVALQAQLQGSVSWDLVTTHNIWYSLTMIDWWQRKANTDHWPSNQFFEEPLLNISKQCEVKAHDSTIILVDLITMFERHLEYWYQICKEKWQLICGSNFRILLTGKVKWYPREI